MNETAAKKKGDAVVEVAQVPSIIIVTTHKDNSKEDVERVVSLDTGTWIETSSLLRRIAAGPNAPGEVAA